MASRRKFLQAVAGGALMARAVQAAKQAGGAPLGSVPKGKYKIPVGARVPMRRLGRTGADVSIVGLGGYHLGLPPEQEAIRMVQRALDHGMNFLDNCWDYNGGESERRMGKALRDGYRSKAFVMTKLDGRTAKSAGGQMEQSLERLQTDVIDLVQIHEVIRPDDPEKCFATGGTIEALVAAQKAGKLRFIGFTGHKDPDIHRHMLDVARAQRFSFDTVQMPINVLDAHYRSFERDVMPVALKDGVAVLGMKPMGSGLILQSGQVGEVQDDATVRRHRAEQALAHQRPALSGLALNYWCKLVDTATAGRWSPGCAGGARRCRGPCTRPSRRRWWRDRPGARGAWPRRAGCSRGGCCAGLPSSGPIAR